MAIVDTVEYYIPQLTSEGITDAMLSAYVSTTLGSFSSLFPQETVAEITATGTTSVFTLPINWENRFSSVLQIEYPADQDPPEFIDEEYYTIGLDGATGLYKLKFLNMTPSSNFYLYYTIRWEEADLTVFDADSVAFLTAALICDRLAAKYASAADERFSADIVVFGSISKKYEDVRDNFLQQFALRTGVNPRKLEPVAALGYTKSYLTATINGLFRSITDA
jgi:hypothetical protein